MKVILFCGSAGGLEVFFNFLKEIELPKNVCVVGLFHRASSYKDVLSKIASQYNEGNVYPGEHGTKLEAGNVYIAPGGYHILLEEDLKITLNLDEKVHYCRPSADVSLESFSYVLHDNLIAIIVSGANEDGGDGVKYVIKRKGKVIVQDPKDAEYPEMPEAAFDSIKEEAVLSNSQDLAMTTLNILNHG